VLAGGTTLAQHSVELLSDLPSTACMLVAIAFLVEELSREHGPRWRLCTVAPLFAAAFHIRYGACLSIASIGVVFVVVAAIKGHLRSWPLLTTCVLTIGLFVPHAIWSHARTGSLTGVLHMSAAIPPPASSVLGYLARPLSMYGVLVAPLMAIGLLAARRGWSYAAILWVALSQLIVLSVTTEAQARYVFLATVLLAMLGVDAMIGFARLTRDKARGVLATVAALGLVASWVITLAASSRYLDRRREGPVRALIAGAVIAADRDPAEPCEVLATDTTRTEWYSGCVAVHVASSNRAAWLYEVRLGTDPSLPDGAVRIAFLPGIVDVIRLR